MAISVVFWQRDSVLTDKIYERARQYRNKCMEFERYLLLSIKPKSRIIEDHSCEQKNIFNGIRDLEEIFGDLNRQYKSILDRWHGGTHEFSLSWKINPKEESQFNHPGVQDKVNYIKTIERGNIQWRAWLVEVKKMWAINDRSDTKRKWKFFKLLLILIIR